MKCDLIKPVLDEAGSSNIVNIKKQKTDAKSALPSSNDISITPMLSVGIQGNQTLPERRLSTWATDNGLSALSMIPSNPSLTLLSQGGPLNTHQQGLSLSPPFFPVQYSSSGIITGIAAPPLAMPGIKVELADALLPTIDTLDPKYYSPLVVVSSFDPTAPTVALSQTFLRPPIIQSHTSPAIQSIHQMDVHGTQSFPALPKTHHYNHYSANIEHTSTHPALPGLSSSRNETDHSGSSVRASDFASSNASSTLPYNDYGIEILKEPLGNCNFDWNNLEFVDQIIEKVDHHFLKHHFDFNTTLQRTKVTFKCYRASDRLPSKDLIDGKKIKKEPIDFGDPVIKKESLFNNVFLTELNIEHFKFLLCLHAFTLNTPGFCIISPSDLKKLFEIYFYKVNSIFPMVFEEEFWELYSRNKIPNVMLYAVVLNAARDELAEPILKRSFVNKNVEFSKNYISFLNKLEMKIRQLLMFLPELADTEKLTRLVTQVLLAHSFKYNKFGSEQSSGDITDCIGYAHSLAIHQDFFHKKIIQSGAVKKSLYLRRLWWVLFIFDRFNGLLNGKAFFIRRLDFNIDRPTDMPSLDKLVGLAYTLEDTSIAIYRTKRKSDKDAAPIQPDKAPGDPEFNPRLIVENEFKLINDPSHNRRNLVVDAISENCHLPTISKEVYRNRIIYFLERLVNFWVILILRLSQIKAMNGNFDQDSFLVLLNERIFESFKALRGEHGHKLVITTPVIPLVLLSAFSSPIKAQMFGRRKLSKEADKGRPVESFKITDSYKKELAHFADKWWFIKEVLRTFEQLQQQVETSKDNEPLATHRFERKNVDKLSIGSLLTAVNDAETVLPLQLSIASPGFYEEVFVKEEEDDEVEPEMPMEPKEKAETVGENSLQKMSASSSIEVIPVNDDSLAEQPTEDGWGTSSDLNNLVLGSEMANSMKLLLADEVNFDISDMAEMVNLEMSFIPTVMDFFNVPHNFI